MQDSQTTLHLNPILQHFRQPRSLRPNKNIFINYLYCGWHVLQCTQTRALDCKQNTLENTIKCFIIYLRCLIRPTRRLKRLLLQIQLSTAYLNTHSNVCLHMLGVGVLVTETWFNTKIMESTSHIFQKVSKFEVDNLHCVSVCIACLLPLVLKFRWMHLLSQVIEIRWLAKYSW